MRANDSSLRHQARGLMLRLYRLGVFLLIAWLVRDQHVRWRIAGQAPVDVEEVRPYLQDAFRLIPDRSEKRGLFVLNREGEEIGYAVRTSPESDHIVGYVGATDTLVVLNEEMRVVGIVIRGSDDTRLHVQDIREDRQFMRRFRGKTWQELAELDFKKARIEGVAGSTMTSMAVAQGIRHRFLSSPAEAESRSPIRWESQDLGLALVVVLALILAFFKPDSGRVSWRPIFQVFVVGYVGLLQTDLLAQSLTVGWMKSGFPWRNAPGMAVLILAAFLVPWGTRRPLYCHHICPHGVLQEWVGKLTRGRYRLRLSSRDLQALKWIPWTLLLVILVSTLLALDVDPGALEPFDAYALKGIWTATAMIAILGLIASLFLPMAYCKVGCPTGALLEFFRSRGDSDRFGRRDWGGLILLLVALACHANWQAWIHWVLGDAPLG